MERLTFTTTEAATVLGISRTSAYELVRSGTLPSLRLGRRIVITKIALEGLLGCALPAPDQPRSAPRSTAPSQLRRPGRDHRTTHGPGDIECSSSCPQGLAVTAGLIENYSAAVETVGQGQRKRFVGGLNRVGVHPQRHRRVGVTQAAGDRPHVMPARDRHRCRPVSKVVEAPVTVDSREVPGALPPPPDAVGIGRPLIHREHVGRDLPAFLPKLLDLGQGSLVEPDDAARWPSWSVRPRQRVRRRPG